MTTLSIADSLKYAQLQMAAEAFLVTGSDNKLKPDLVTALTEGNKHSSKFPTKQAAVDFLDHWKVVDQKANTASGFSGTLFECVQDDPATGAKKGELVLSMRSTEFVDDAVNDCQVTNKTIKDFGWGFGQIADMEKWYAELKSSDKINAATDNFSVTGYSLGGHLATAFNLLRQEEAAAGARNPITNTVTFNGAGVGVLKSSTLHTTIDTFNTIRNNVGHNDDLFSNTEIQKLYHDLAVRQETHVKTAIANDMSSKDASWFITAEEVRAASLIQTQEDKYDASTREQAKLLHDAMARAQEAQIEYFRIEAEVTSGDGKKPTQPTTMSQMSGLSVDYWLAVLSAAKNTASTNTIAPYSRAPGGNIANFYDVFGQEYANFLGNPSAVANSQLHYGTPQGVFIESQPLYRGKYVWDVVTQTLAFNDIKLLNDNYKNDDFGDTHSLVLIMDSLSLQNVLLQLDPKATPETLNNLLMQASNLESKTLGSAQGKCEGDVLENVVNALSALFLDPSAYTKLRGNPNGNTWFEIENKDGYTSRKEFYNNLNMLTKVIGGDDFKALQGQLTLSTAAADATTARTDFATFLALYNLNPFVLTATGDAKDKLDAVLQKAQKDIYTEWKNEKDLTPAQRAAGEGTFSDKYLQDRADMLKWLIKSNQENWVDGNGDAIVYGANIGYNKILEYFDQDSGKKVTVVSYTKGRNAAENTTTQHIVFSGIGSWPFPPLGMGDDVVYHFDKTGIKIDGNDGNNKYTCGSGNDTMCSGSGDETFCGGGGVNTYTFKPGCGHDEIDELPQNGVRKGIIKIDSIGDLHGAEATNNLNIWRDESNNIDYIWNKKPDGSGGLLIRYNNGNDSISIPSFNNGDFGINLAIKNSPPITNVTAFTNQSDFINVSYTDNKTEVTGLNGLDDVYKKILTGTSYTIHGEDGNDFITAEGSDSATCIADGGDGNDYISVGRGVKASGGNGDDYIDGLASLAFPASARLPTQWRSQFNSDLEAYSAALSGLTINIKGLDLGGDYFNNWSGLSYAGTLYAGANRTVPITADYGGREYHQGYSAWLSGGPKELEGLINILPYSPLNKDGMPVDKNWASQFFDKQGIYADGGAGNDFIGGSLGKDTLLGSDGQDTLFGSTGNDLLNGGAGNDQLAGSIGDDSLVGEDGKDTLYGGDGNDYLDGGEGDDLLLGGEGIFLDVSDADQEWQRDGNDEMHGGAGNDTLWGGAGNNRLFGDAGNDVLVGNEHNIKRDNQSDTYLDGVSPDKQGNNYLDGGDGNDTLLGGVKNDTLRGGSGDDYLMGDDGNDTLYGGDGNDGITSFELGKAPQYNNGGLFGGKGNDVLYGGTGMDLLEGGEGNDILWGEAGKGILFGGADNDELHGGDEMDSLDGGDGDDTLWGEGGNDILFGDANNDSLNGGDGDDYLGGGDGKDTLLGGAGNDNLLGGDGDDYLDGGAGNDGLLGGIGNDTLVASSSGVKVLDGGEGDDEYRISANATVSYYDKSGRNTIVFENTKSANDVSFAEVWTTDGQKVGLISGGGASVLLTTGSAVSGIQLAGGEKLSFASLVEKYARDNNKNIQMEGSGIWADNSDSNWLTVGSAYTHVAGGKGNDNLNLAGDNKQISYYIGDGVDTLTGGVNASKGNTIVFGQGISAADLKFRVINGGLTIEAGSSRNAIRVEGLNFDGNTGAWIQSSMVSDFQFADGTASTLAALLEQNGLAYMATSSVHAIDGTQGADSLGGTGGDTFRGKEGDDTLLGSVGNNTYCFNLGDGKDTVIESGTNSKIVFGAGITQDSLQVKQYIDDGIESLQISYSDNDVITVKNSAAHGVMNYEFSDGTVCTWQDILYQANGINITGTDQAETLKGTRGNDTIKALAGNDTIIAGDGNDILMGGSGSDVLYGGGGVDTYWLESGDDDKIIESDNGKNILRIGVSDPSSALEKKRDGNDLLVFFAESNKGARLVDFYTGNQTWSVEGKGGDQVDILTIPDRKKNPNFAGEIKENGLRLIMDAMRNEYSVNNNITWIGNSFYDVRVYGYAGDAYSVSDKYTNTGTLTVNSVNYSYDRDHNDTFGSRAWTFRARGYSNWSPWITDPPASYASIVESMIASTKSSLNFLWNNRERVWSERIDSWNQMYGSLYKTLKWAELQNTMENEYGSVDALTENITTLSIDDVKGTNADDQIRIKEGCIVDAGSGNDLVYGKYLEGGRLDRHFGSVLLGGDGNDTIYGSYGEDSIYGGNDNDVLDGGFGSDKYFVANESGVDTIWEFTRPTARIPELSASNFTLTEKLFANGTLERNTVVFGPGVAANSLKSSWGQIEDKDGKLFVTLDIYWADGRGVRIVMPRDDEGYFGQGNAVSGISDFEFSNGQTLTLADLVKQAGDVPQTFSPILKDVTAHGAAELCINLPDEFLSFNYGATYSATQVDSSPLPDWLRFDPSTRQFTGTPPSGVKLEYSILVGAAWATGETSADVFVLTIESNSAPVATANLANAVAVKGTGFSYVIPANCFTDPDREDVLSYSATLLDGKSLPDWLKFDAATATFSGTPADGDVGSLQVRVMAIDNDGATASQAFNLSVTVANTDHAPEVGTAIGNQIATEDQALSFVVPGDAFKDVDAGDKLTYAATLANGDPLPAWLSFDADTQSFKGMPSNSNVGLLQLQVMVTDLSGASVTQTFSVEVINVNDAPVVSAPIVDQSAKENQPFSFSILAGTFKDVDAGDVLSYSATLADGNPLPAWLTFNADTLTFSGTPSHDSADLLDIQIMATDKAGATVADAFSLSVGKTIISDWQSDHLTGGAGDDVVNATGGSTYIDLSAGNNTATASYGNDTIVAGSGDNVINSGGGNNQIRVGNGNNQLYTDYGDDSITTGSGNNVIQAGGGKNIVTAGSGNDQVFSTWGDDSINAGDGNNVIQAGGGDNTVIAGSGNDTITTLWGYDTINAGDGNNVIDAGGGFNHITSGSGDDVILADGMNLISAGAGNDQITITSWGSDTIDGGAGDDIIRAGGGNNVLRGGTGNDQFFSSEWSDDQYLFAKGDGQDIIQDGGGRDTLKLEGISADQLWFRHVDNNLEISVMGVNDKITVKDWYSGNQNHLDVIQATDGKVLLDSQVDALVSAMAAFTPPAAGETSLTQAMQDQLQPVLAANWH